MQAIILLSLLSLISKSLASQCGLEEPPHVPTYSATDQGQWEIDLPLHATNASLRWINDGKVEHDLDIDLFGEHVTRYRQGDYKVTYHFERKIVPWIDEEIHVLLCYNLTTLETDASGKLTEKQCTRCGLVLLCCQHQPPFNVTTSDNDHKIQFNVRELPVSVAYVRGYRVEQISTSTCAKRISRLEKTNVLQTQDGVEIEWVGLKPNTVSHARLNLNVEVRMAVRLSFDLKFELENGEVVVIENILWKNIDSVC